MSADAALIAVKPGKDNLGAAPRTPDTSSHDTARFGLGADQGKASPSRAVLFAPKKEKIMTNRTSVPKEAWGTGSRS